MIRQYTFKLDASKVKLTDEGYLDCVGACARIGIQTYHDNGKPFKEFRSEKEVFDKASLDSHKQVPITVQHPDELVNSESFKNLTVGITGTNPRRDGDFLLNELRIMDKGAVKWVNDRIDKGESVEISMGYNADVDPGQGVFKDESYDASQKNIRINHAALCDQGTARAGREAKLRLDNDQSNLISYLLDHQKKDKKIQKVIISKNKAESLEFARKIAKEFGEITNPTETHLGFEFEQIPQDRFELGTERTFNISGGRGITLVFGKLKGRKGSMKNLRRDKINTEGFHMDQIDLEYHDESENVVSLLNRKLDECVETIKKLAGEREKSKKDSDDTIATMKTDSDKIQAKADQLEEDIKKKNDEISELSDLESDRMKKLINDKAMLKAVAGHFDIDIKDKTDKDIKVCVIQKVSTDFKADDEKATDGYVDARYDQICDTIRKDIEKMDKSKESLSSFIKGAEDGKKGSGKKIDHRAKYIADQEGKWKPESSKTE